MHFQVFASFIVIYSLSVVADTQKDLLIKYLVNDCVLSFLIGLNLYTNYKLNLEEKNNVEKKRE